MIQSSAAAIILPCFPTQPSFHFPSKPARGGPIPRPFISNRSGEVQLRCRSTSSVQPRLPGEASSSGKQNRAIESNFHSFESPTGSCSEHGDDGDDFFIDVDNLLYLLRFSTKYSDVELARAVHASILKIEEDTHLGNVLIGVYLKLGLVLEAYQVFKNLSEPNVVSYSSLISGLAKSNREIEAVELFFRMRSSEVEPNEYSFVAILTACMRASGFELGCQIHALAIKLGYLESVFVANALMALYGKSSQCLDSAIQLFDEMPERDITSWNTVISSLIDGLLYEKALEYGRDLAGAYEFEVDELTLLAFLTACTGCHAIRQGKEIHGRAMRLGLAASLSLCNAMIGFYAKCGTVENVLAVFDGMQIRDVITWTQLVTAYMEFGLVDSAVKTFEKMPERNSISYNAVLAGFSRNSQGLNALNFFSMMVRNGIELSCFSLTSVITACGLLADPKTSRQIHGFVTKFGYGLNPHIESSLLDMYARCGKMRDAEKLYADQDDSSVALTSMMSGYARNGQPDEAISHFHRSLSAGNVAMDEVVLTTALGVCGALGFLELGKQIHSCVVKSGFKADLGVGSSLVSMYSKCGEMVDSIKSFDPMLAHDVVSWNSLISGHVLHRQGDKALALWSAMEKAGVRPDSITFVLLISAYKHTTSNLVDQCRTMFLSMKPAYQIEPATEHYATFVSVLGFWGLIEEAEEMILQLPFEPEVSIWRTLLDSCRLHMNTATGRRVAKRILAMEPRDPSTFVLVSNLYSASGRWHCSEATRQEMREKGMRKQPCRSWFIHENTIHSFYVRDVSHPQSIDIYRGLEVLILECMKTGYEPDTSFVLHEVEEHQKKEFLFYHSAKLAATYGLLMTSPGQVIRIVKNVHVCGDCHSFLKHASAVSRREIALRDASGFHFFSDGQCSCRDYR